MINLTREKKIKIIFYLCLISGFSILLFFPPTRYCIKLIISSFVLSYLLKPIVNILVYKLKINKKIASVIALLFVVFITIFLLYKIAGNIFREWDNIGKLLDALQSYIFEIQKKINLNSNSFTDQMTNSMFENINRLINNIGADFIDSIMTFSGDIFGYIIVPLMSYYFLVDGGKMVRSCISFIKPSSRKVVKNILYDIDNMLNKYILSQIILSGVVTLITFIILIIFKVPFPFFLSIVNGIFNIIPYFGPFLGGIPCILSAFSVSNEAGLWVVVFLVLLQQLEGNLLCPIFTSYSVKIHPLAVITLIILGERVGGIMGMILAVPIGIIVKQIVDDIDYYCF